MRALSGTDVTPQVLPMGIGRSAVSQVKVSGECCKGKDWRRKGHSTAFQNGAEVHQVPIFSKVRANSGAPFVPAAAKKAVARPTAAAVDHNPSALLSCPSRRRHLLSANNPK